MSTENGNSRFALVPRPPSAIEKAEPGAKRVVALMVSDTLAIAQKHLAPAVTSPTKSEMDNWYQDKNGCLRHNSGKFFSIVPIKRASRRVCIYYISALWINEEHDR